MTEDFSKLAHERLTALAKERRRSAENLPALGPEARCRLQEEVAQLRQGKVVPEKRRESQVTWTNWLRPWLPWIACAAAIIPLLLIVFFPVHEEEAKRGMPTQVASYNAPEPPSFEIPPMPESLAAPLPEQIVTNPPRPTAVARGTTAAATSSTTASPTSSSATRLAAEKPVPNPRPAGRTRLRYAAVPSGTAPLLLSDFEVLQTGLRLELRDADGSLYTGRVAPLVAISARSAGWSFEARGRSRTLGKPVAITGNFGAAPLASADAGTPSRSAPTPTAEEGALGLPLSMTIQVGGSNIIEQRALPRINP